MDKQAWPIGVFDSGLGGLTVVKEIIKLLPNENIIYLGDTARVPYGTRSNEVIKKFSLEDVNFLLSKDVKCIVIACHTSSAVAGDFLKKIFHNIPIFDVISPILKKYKDNNNQIGVIGTGATITSKVYSKLKNVVQQPCPLFVPLIEEGEVSGNLITLLADKYLREMKNKKVKILILGCTHYPLISKVIVEVFPNVRLINPATFVASELKDFLIKNNLVNAQKRIGKKSLYVTDLNNRFREIAEMFLGEKLKGRVVKVNIN